jgi:DNA-binding NarL/FixJ family response regulator
VTEKELSTFLGDKRAVIVDSSSSQVSIKRLLTQSGVKLSNIGVTNDFIDGEAKIKSIQPQILFCEYLMGTRSGLDLFNLLRESYPSDIDRTCIMLSDKNSEAVTCSLAEEGVDALIIQPFTFGDLQKKFREVIARKISPPPVLKLVAEGNQLLAEKKYQESLGIFSKARTLESNLDLIFYCESQVYRAMNDNDKCEAALRFGLKANSKNYKCLTSLYSILLESKRWEEAYETSEVLLKNFPVNPKRIPDIIRLAVTLGKFQDLISYYEIFTALEETDDNVNKYVAAGLTVCGKYFLRNGDPDSARQALKTAESTCRGNSNILREIISTFIEAKLSEETARALSALPRNLSDKLEFKVLELLHVSSSSPASQALKLGDDLLRKGVKDVKVFEIVLLKSLEANRGPEIIRRILEEAIRSFPEKQRFFEDIVEVN